MDWWTVYMLAAVVISYSIGKGIGRAQGRDAARRETPPHICLSLEIEGEVIGGLHLGGLRVGHHDVGDAVFPTDRPGPPPGHPEAEQ